MCFRVSSLCEEQGATKTDRDERGTRSHAAPGFNGARRQVRGAGVTALVWGKQIIHVERVT